MHCIPQPVAVAAAKMLLLFAIMTTPIAVQSFSYGHFSRRSGSSMLGFRFKQNEQTPYDCNTLYARGGAMARRKKRDNNKHEDESNKSDTIYSVPPLYDLAFGYRNYEEEVEFLIDAHNKYTKFSIAEPLRIIELAAGPARHSLAALSEHSSDEIGFVMALDKSQDMVNYGIDNADFQLGEGSRRDDFSYITGDMRDIMSSGNDDLLKNSKIDTVWLLLGSMQHLLTNDDIIACFQSIHSILRHGGTVVIELPHPRETFSMGECTKNGWTIPLIDEVNDDGDEKEYGELNIIWGDADDEFNPVTQVRRFTVCMELSIQNPKDIPQDSSLFRKMTEDGKTRLKEIVPMRLFTFQELDALARCSGLEMVAKYGALDKDVSIEDEDEAFRMVCVLRKTMEG